MVIVREQHCKENLPECLSDLLCLTVYESKGLEFDDVILFNFFEDSTIESQWKLLNEVEITEEEALAVAKSLSPNLDDF